MITYNTYCLKVLAGINSFYPTLADRCILLRLKQPPVDISLEYYGGEDVSITLPLVELIHSSLKSKLPELQKYIVDPKLLAIDDLIRLREFDKWFPILAIAKLFSSRRSNYFNLLQNYALVQVNAKIEQESSQPENMCKGILKEFLEYKAGEAIDSDRKSLFFKTDEIQSVIRANDPHNYYRNKAEITRLLKTLGIETARKRFGGPPVSLYSIPRSFLN
ncbi:MAG: hypothetical protein HYV28_13265 [Ignavibacteriales bacterium]|nr:hypothetical protein [Ignavibacteriales bacterium]